MTNTRKWLMILILPFIFVSSFALAVFDENLSKVCEKSSGSIIKVYQGLGSPAPAGSSPFKQAADTSNEMGRATPFQESSFFKTRNGKTPWKN